MFEHERCGRNFPLYKKPLQANLSDVEPHESDSIPKGKETEKLEFEQSPNETRLRKTAFRRESLQPRQATERLAEIDLVRSMQDLEHVGAAFGDYQVSSETLDSQMANGFVDIVNPEFKSKIQLGARTIPYTFSKTFFKDFQLRKLDIDFSFF